MSGREPVPHEHLPEPDLIEAALAANPGAGPGGPDDEARRAFSACAECSRRLERASAWLADLRGALGTSDVLEAPEGTESGSEAERRLVERVLASTTREDLGLRGDLRLAWSYARSAVRKSAALRVAAALLVVQLAALPVLAWIVLRSPGERPHFTGTLELPRDPVYQESEAEPERAISADEPAEPRLREDELARGEELAAIAHRRAEARALRSAEAPRVGPTEPRDALARLLWARARQIETGELSDTLRSWVDEPATDASAVELALRLDVLLDRWSLSGERPTAARALALALIEAGRSERSALAARALRRAELHGLIAPAEAREPRSGGPDARAVPLDRAWSDALESLDAGGNEEREALIRAWIDALR